MLRLAFRCPACQGGPDPKTFPLCQRCRDSLVPAPRLCASCASPACGQEADDRGCIHPWTTPVVDSYTARYLLVGPGYAVLRKWKTSHGPLFDRQVLQADTHFFARLAARGIRAIVPIPQHPERAWRLGGSPALTIATWLARRLTVPVIAALQLERRRGIPHRHQAKLRLQERLQNRIVFDRALDATSLQRRPTVLLVDDFMTTGRTLRAAAEALRMTGVREIHGFCLGVRPRLTHAPSRRQ